MISVKCQYLNAMGKTKKDYFIFTDIEVTGHAEHTGYNTNIKVCAGISACCLGIRRLIDDDQFYVEYKSGYYHVWTNKKIDLKQTLDRDSVHALNTLVCQLYEIYCLYPSAFKSFDLVDIKEKIEDEERKRNQEEQQWSGCTRPRKRSLQGVGFHSLIEKTHS